MRNSISSAVLLLTVLAASAAPPVNPGRLVRFLAVGDSPPFRQEVRDGVRSEMAPLPDSIPPRELILDSGKEASKPVSLSLCRLSSAVAMPAGEGTLALRPGSGKKPWFMFKGPESGDLLVCLFRDPAKTNWQEPLSVSVPEGPAGSVRIVNLHAFPANVIWAGETLAIPASSHVLKTLEPGMESPFQVLAADKVGGSMRRYFSGSVAQKAGERGLIVIYRADEVQPRRPVKVLVLKETAAR